MINYKSIKCLYTIKDPDVVDCVAITPDGEKFVSSAYFPLKVRQTNTGKLLHTLYPDELAWSLAISEDSQLLAAGCDEQTTDVWNLQTGEKLHTFHHSMEFPREVSAVAFTPDKKILLSGGAGEIDLWDLQTGKQISPSKRAGSALALSQDGKILVSNRLSVVRIYHFPSGELLHELENPQPLDCVHSVAINGPSTRHKKIW